MYYYKRGILSTFLCSPYSFLPFHSIQIRIFNTPERKRGSTTGQEHNIKQTQSYITFYCCIYPSIHPFLVHLFLVLLVIANQLTILPSIHSSRGETHCFKLIYWWWSWIFFGKVADAFGTILCVHANIQFVHSFNVYNMVFGVIIWFNFQIYFWIVKRKQYYDMMCALFNSHLGYKI